MRLLPLLLLAACATRFATVDRQPGIDGSWSEGTSSLDISGSKAVLSFEGRLFVFDAPGNVHGTILEDEVWLAGEGLEITADRERIVFSTKTGEVARPLASLPAGSRFLWRDGELKPG
ncbi:MAG: hypothetical protein ACHQ1G_03840 [Planctomycetota bacterium]